MESGRRQFLEFTAVGISAALDAHTTPPGKPVRLGGPVFLKSDDPAALAREHRRLGYSAAYCPAAEIADTARIAAIEKSFAAENVVIAEVGAWVNMLDPDAEKRAKNVQYVVQRLALAEAVGARTCVDIAGTYNPDVWYGPHPRNLSQEFFDATVENCRKVIGQVNPKRTRFSIEMMGWSIPDGPDSYVKLVRAIDRKAFGVHMDVCNGVNCPARFYQNTAFIRECFDKLGPSIVSCHAKDLDWITELNVHFLEVAPGLGKMDYATYLRCVASLQADVPLMLEHLKTADEYAGAARYIRKVAAEAGVSFA